MSERSLCAGTLAIPVFRCGRIYYYEALSIGGLGDLPGAAKKPRAVACAEVQLR